MLRTFLIATALLTASGTALARDSYHYGHVVAPQPHLSVTLSSGHHDSYPVVYGSGSRHYTAPRSYYPSHYVAVPPHHGGHYDYGRPNNHSKRHHGRGHH